MDTKEALAKLQKTRASIDELIAPPMSGVYAIFLKQGRRFPISDISGNRLIYIGESRNLQSRVHEMHFGSDGSGFSTLQRSIGALMKSELKLIAVSRGKGVSASNFNNYRFERSGEERLAKWMKENLEIGICPIDKDYKFLQNQLIATLCPILCLQGCLNQYAAYIKDLRKICSQEARQRYTEHL